MTMMAVIESRYHIGSGEGGGFGRVTAVEGVGAKG